MQYPILLALETAYTEKSLWDSCWVNWVCNWVYEVPGYNCCSSTCSPKFTIQNFLVSSLYNWLEFTTTLTVFSLLPHTRTQQGYWNWGQIYHRGMAAERYRKSQSMQRWKCHTSSLCCCQWNCSTLGSFLWAAGNCATPPWQWSRYVANVLIACLH